MSRHGVLASMFVPVLALILTMSGATTAHAAAPQTSATSQLATQTTQRATAFPLRVGDRAWRVRVVQSRLHQLGLHSEVVHNRFDAETRRGVVAFKQRHGLKANGLMTKKAWEVLLTVTEQPTKDALHNIYEPGKPLLKRGAKGKRVRNLQARLKQISWYSGRITGRYQASTVKSVRGFQKKRRIPVTGKVDRRTLDRLHEMTRKPTRAEMFNQYSTDAPLDRRCKTGRVLCIDKTSRTLRWVIDGSVRKTVQVRFGSAELPTREGAFSVFLKSREHVSSIYHTPMPFAMFFSGGQAVHYSPDFAANGYNGASHGCVNVRDRAAIRWLFDTQVRIGDKVIVYRS